MREQAVGVRQAAVRGRVLGALGQGLLEEVDGLAQPFFGALIQVVAALQVQVLAPRGSRPGA